MAYSKKTRPYRAGKQIGKALAETANILYLLDNRGQYLSGVRDVIDAELESIQWKTDHYVHGVKK